MSLVNAVIVASHVPIAATVVLAAARYQRLGRALRAFSWFVFLSGGIQLASLLLCYCNRNNMPLLHLYVAAGFPCLVWFYKTILGDFVSRWVIVTLIALFLLFTAVNSLFIQDIFRFNSNALTLESILVMILALSTYTFFLNDATKENGIRDVKSLTWINSGLFVYYSSCLLIFYFGDTILFRYSKDLSRLTWIFHAFFSTVMYACFFTGLWNRSKTLPS